MKWIPLIPFALMALAALLMRCGYTEAGWYTGGIGLLVLLIILLLTWWLLENGCRKEMHDE